MPESCGQARVISAVARILLDSLPVRTSSVRPPTEPEPAHVGGLGLAMILLLLLALVGAKEQPRVRGKVSSQLQQVFAPAWAQSPAVVHMPVHMRDPVVAPVSGLVKEWILLVLVYVHDRVLVWAWALV